MSAPMSLRQYAKSRKMALSTLQHHIERGNVEKEPDGKIDPEKADSQLLTRINGPQSRRAAGRKKLNPPTTGDGAPLSDGDLSGLTVEQARRLREITDLRMARIRLEKEEGLLVNAKEVEAAQFTMARALRNSLQGIPARVADELAALTDAIAIRRRLEEEIRHALQSAAEFAAELAEMNAPAGPDQEPAEDA